jgi:hypothetical protein
MTTLTIFIFVAFLASFDNFSVPFIYKECSFQFIAFEDFLLKQSWTFKFNYIVMTKHFNIAYNDLK